MDENFNSLAEEQKEGGVLYKAENVKERIQSAVVNEISDDKLGGNGNKPDKLTLEKLAELTAVMNRFELDVISANNSPRARCSSEPSCVRAPRTHIVRSCGEVHEDDNSASAPSEGASSLEPLTPPAATSERKVDPRIFFSSLPYEDRYVCRGIQDHWHNYHEKSPENENQAYPGYLWSGELPPRNYSNPTFSSKIFVGGVPWDITETALIDAFSPYGNCRVEWPCKEARSSRSNKTRGKVTGYVYMVFETERSVRLLLQDCSQEFGSAGEWYFKLKARRNQSSEIRQVQVIPWVVSDSCYNDDPSYPLDPKKTVFVGALHGMLTAHVLFSIMNELYGNVVFVGIDTDKYKYPIGSGRVTFRSHASYFRAIESAFLEIRTSKFSKRVQIDPFLEDSWCMVCGEAQGPYFCRDRTCFRYYCGACWQILFFGPIRYAESENPHWRVRKRRKRALRQDGNQQVEVSALPFTLPASGAIFPAPISSHSFALGWWRRQARHFMGGKNSDHRPLMRHAPRSPLRSDNFGAYVEPLYSTVPRHYFNTLGSPSAQPLGGAAAVAAVARGTVPRQQHHAYHYMQLAPSYAAMYPQTMLSSPCRVTSTTTPTSLLAGLSNSQSVTTSSAYVQQRLY